MKRSSVEAALSALADAGEPLDVLEAAGMLVVLGAQDQIGSVEVTIELGAGEVDEAAYEAIDALGQADALERLRAAFSIRDAVELRRIGAEAVLGHEPELSLEDEIALVAFDEALRPHLWRLTAMNEWRALEVAWMRPEHRRRFWWWSEASEVDPRGAIHLDAVAELIARFPSAERELRKLAATELLLRSDASAAVIDLGRWLRDSSPEISMAAATGQRERVLFEHSSFTLSLLPPDALLIDLLEPRGENLPRLRIGSTVLESEAVPDALERYRFDLTELLTVTDRVQLVVSLSSGVVRVLLPPEST